MDQEIIDDDGSYSTSANRDGKEKRNFEVFFSSHAHLKLMLNKLF